MNVEVSEKKVQQGDYLVYKYVSNTHWSELALVQRSFGDTGYWKLTTSSGGTNKDISPVDEADAYIQALTLAKERLKKLLIKDKLEGKE
jgi:hypothetical protein